MFLKDLTQRVHIHCYYQVPTDHPYDGFGDLIQSLKDFLGLSAFAGGFGRWVLPVSSGSCVGLSSTFGDSGNKFCARTLFWGQGCVSSTLLNF